MGIPEGEEREQEIEKMTENFSKLAKEMDIQVKNQRVPNKINPEKLIPRHIIIKMLKVKDKERIFKEATEK